MSAIDKILNKIGLLRKTSVIPEYHMESESKVRIPEWDLKTLYDVASRSWVLQEIYRAIIQEVKRPGWNIKPKFTLKCEDCGMEYQTNLKRCEVCGSKNLRPPDLVQKKRALSLLEKPNSNRESFGDIIGSIVYHDLVADDWYLSIEFARAKIGSDELFLPKEIRVQNPAFIFPIMDEFGHLGKSDEWFCPFCFHYSKNPQIFSRPGVCPSCGGELQETAYVQRVNNEITSRWSVKQMVHGSTYRVLPSVFGSPRAKSLWDIIHILFAMDEWFYDTFREARLEKMVIFEGYTQDKITELIRKVQSEIGTLRTMDARTGRLRTKKNLRTIYLGMDAKAQVIDIGISPEKIQLLDYYKQAITAACGVYGVQPISIAFVEKGKAGTTPAMQIEVQNRTIREIQRDKEEIFNQQLFPIFGIRDWVFKFNSLEKRDIVRETEVLQGRANAAMTLLNAGFDVWFDEFGELHWSSRPVRPPLSLRPTGALPAKHKISGATGREIQGTTTERQPFGPRPATQQDEEREK